jgi:transposase-like protein
MAQEPRTLMEAVRYFADPDVSLKHMVELRWPNGVQCPTCKSKDVRWIPTRRLWECKAKHTRKQFSAKVGTIFEDSALPLDKWFVAIWMVANCKNGVSSYEMARTLGITQKSAWHMNHRIRLAMRLGTIEKMDGVVEADEAYIGGIAKNMHAWRRDRLKVGTGSVGKTAVVGMLQRTREKSPSRVSASVVANTTRTAVHGLIRERVVRGSTLYTDNYVVYDGLSEYVRGIINHAREYVNGHVHTNGIENFWSLLKRGLRGTYVSVEPFHLNRYVDEQVFRFNEREGSDADRFRTMLRRVTGKRLTYQELTSGTIAAAA